MKDFQKELEELINSHSIENRSDTPDFILAEYLSLCLQASDIIIKKRDKWYGINPYPGWGKAEQPTGKVGKPCHILKYCPYGPLVENFPLSDPRNEKSCKVFGHDCPVFTHAESLTEQLSADYK